ncbi:MAG: proline--tRNA ligase [Candidatus Eisenbacteria bacterium]|nr:proline--tRNA ligase [Candidatus Eisenbacteria bacterium]MCC7141180.1 proline--tRNA ligase [Candidatus Eisenbacteria bacterium]
MGNDAITPREKDFSQWYLDVIKVAELADHSPVRGCMVIRPNGYAIWEKIQAGLDRRIKETGHQNAYFPLFIPESFLKKEAQHVEGFSPELAVVTIGGGKTLEEPLVVRPTSETIIYSMFSKWVNSYRDLPLLINQWANVVRWEMRTRLFLRTTEFLWQEGHTCHTTEAEAEEEVLRILDLYADFVENEMAVPVLRGLKSDNERFAGALRTWSIEAMMQDGKALQAGTSHNLGQNFSVPFNVRYQDQQSQMQYAWMTSWGVSTRLVGALIMAHSDDAGLICPPRLAPLGAVIVPIWSSDEDKAAVLPMAQTIADALRPFTGVKVDDREQMRPGSKYAEWEQRGIPIRIEVGPKDVAKAQCVMVRRDTRKKEFVPIDGIANAVRAEHEQMQRDLFQRALDFRTTHTREIDTWDEFVAWCGAAQGFGLAHWCGDSGCEAKVKEETKVTIRNRPIEYVQGTKKAEPGRCIKCNGASAYPVYWGIAY